MCARASDYVFADHGTGASRPEVAVGTVCAHCGNLRAPRCDHAQLLPLPLGHTPCAANGFQRGYGYRVKPTSSSSNCVSVRGRVRNAQELSSHASEQMAGMKLRNGDRSRTTLLRSLAINSALVVQLGMCPAVCCLLPKRKHSGQDRHCTNCRRQHLCQVVPK